MSSLWPIPIWAALARIRYLRNLGTLQNGDVMGMINRARQLMTLLVFLGVLVSLLILRLIPGLLLRLALAIPRRRLIALTTTTWRRLQAQRVAIVLSRKRDEPSSDMQLVFFPAPSPAPARGRRVLVSSSLLVLAALVTTAFWTWHSTGLLMFLR